MSTPLDPAGFAQALMYEASDIPPDMTLAQWRREKRSSAPRSRRRRRVVRLRRLALARGR
jgi:hypothetical protein